jgi:hypothetical protein
MAIIDYPFVWPFTRITLQPRHPLAVGMQWLAGLPLSFWLVHTVVPTLPNPLPGILGVIIGYLYQLGVFVIVYALFAALNRIGPFNRLFSILTPTFFYRRYHEPQTNLNDLIQDRALNR